MAVGGIHYNNVHLCIHKGGYPVHHIAGNAYACPAEEPALPVLGGLGVFNLFFNIFDGNKALKVEVCVYNGQLFLPCFGKDGFCFFQCDAFPGSYQFFGGHGFFNFFGKVFFEFQITVCDDAYQLAVFCDGHAGNTEFCH